MVVKLMVMDFLVDVIRFFDTIAEPPPGLGRILVCEDEGLTALRLRRVLTTLGYVVVGEARDGEEAVRLAGWLRPDIILMDIHMPRLDGVGAVVQEYAAGDAETIAQAILQEARQFAAGFLRDDLAIVVLRRTGSNDSSDGDEQGPGPDL